MARAHTVKPGMMLPLPSLIVRLLCLQSEAKFAKKAMDRLSRMPGGGALETTTYQPAATQQPRRHLFDLVSLNRACRASHASILVDGMPQSMYDLVLVALLVEKTHHHHHHHHQTRALLLWQRQARLAHQHDSTSKWLTGRTCFEQAASAPHVEVDHPLANLCTTNCESLHQNSSH